MIRLTRLNQVRLVVNADLIEHIEATPDTVISLMNGQKFIVQETSDEVIERVVEFRRSILSGLTQYDWPARHAVQSPSSAPHPPSRLRNDG